MSKQKGIPEECFERYGMDLDGCSTQQNEGCSRCKLFIENNTEHGSRKDILSHLSYWIKILGWDKKELNNVREFTIKVKMQDRWIPHFCSMLKYIQRLGSWGSSREVGIFADGDGDFRPKFEFDIEFEEVPPVSEHDGNRIYDAG